MLKSTEIKEKIRSNESVIREYRRRIARTEKENEMFQLALERSKELELGE